MDSKRNYQRNIREGDCCNYEGNTDHDRYLLDEHPSRQLLDQHYEDPVAAPVAARRRGGMGWLGWCLFGLLALCAISGGIYLAERHLRNSTTSQIAEATTPTNEIDRMVTNVTPGRGATADQPVIDEYLEAVTVTAVPVERTTTAYKTKAADGYATAVVTPGSVENYVYYFDNDVAEVTDNRVLDNLAEKAAENDAEISITAYASTVGSPAYNKHLTEERAENVADYLIAHGVPSDHIKVISAGQTDTFGDNAHNRRANIHVDYPV